MTLLFFLRSPAGNTDTGQSADGAAPFFDYEELEKPKRKKKLTRKEQRELERKAKEAIEQVATAAATKVLEIKKTKRRREEEALLMLLMHEFDDYDD